MFKLRLPAAAAALSLVAAISASGAQATPIGAFTTRGAWTFVSAPKLHPPKLTINGKPQRGLAPGYFMTGVFKNVLAKGPMIGQSGPLMLDRNLQPVWFDPIGTDALAANLRVQTYQGKPVLSWWQGTVSGTGATVTGEDIVVDQHYKPVAKITGADGWVISEHDMIISGSNAWVTAYKNVPANLTPYGGSADGIVVDSAVQEYDLKTGRLLYTWDAFNPGGTPNIPLSQSEQRPFPGIPWDAYHINSIQLTGDESFLVSMRNTWTAYLVSRTTNAIEWTVSGNPKNSTFALPANAQFQWQHDVELHNGNVLSVFDDHCCEIASVAGGKAKFGKPSGPSRGLVVRLDLTNHTGSLVSQYVRGKNFNAAFLGNAQLLPGGNVTLGWGSTPFFSEVNRKGKLLLDAAWPFPDLNYRTYVQKWVGMPSFPPSGALRNNRVYASWDGATQVASWKVLAGSTAKSLKAVASKTKTGFETTIPLTGSFKVYEVQALDARHHVLGTSKPFPTKGSSNSGLPQAY
jgi:hypothetical protein